MLVEEVDYLKIVTGCFIPVEVEGFLLDTTEKHTGMLPFTRGDYMPQLDILDASMFLKGAQEMLNHKVIIVGITRDDAAQFQVIKENIEHIGQMFAEYMVLLFENDSKDGTKESLQKWQADNSKVKVISMDFNIIKRPSHKFMAYARNQYLNEIYQHQLNNKYDLLMALDMDMPCGYDDRGIKAAFANFSAWDVSCSNGVHNREGSMYDAFAFRSEEFPFTPNEWDDICAKDDQDLLVQCKRAKEIAPGKPIYSHGIVSQIQKTYPANNGLIEVHSCFGGAAFYKMQFLTNCYYDSIADDCEHIKFHQCLREQNGAKIYLNSAQMLNIHYKEYGDSLKCTK